MSLVITSLILLLSSSLFLLLVTCQLFVPGGSLEQETNGVVTGPRECPAATYEKPYKSWMDIFKQK